MKRFFLLLGILSISNIMGQHINFEKTTSFFPGVEVLEQDNIDWGYLNVPENWESSDTISKTKTIKIAVAVVKNLSNKKNADAVVFVQGGPGAGSIQNIGPWRDHPLRNQNDIILVDMRGTGFSSPRLCPDLGQKFLQILAKNQPEETDEKQKVASVLECQQDLLEKGIDIESYHSLFMAKDLNALKTQLGYSKWHIYGASYGTYIAQVYANEYVDDIKTLILDSSIDDMTTYYTQNTSNYMSSLKKVFELCKNDKECNKNYPDLEQVYYKNILNLKSKPIKVSVDSEIINSSSFTYNEEDYKIALQQALYHKELIEIIPLLIYQFQDRNVDALGKLVEAFSNLLSMDYGVYYSVSCNEALPINDISEYQKDVSRYKKIQGGVSFYKSDFAVCQQWNLRRSDSLMVNASSNLDSLEAPVMILSGAYDPITPVSNGKALAKRFKNAYAITIPNYGHVPSFTATGREMLKTFVENPHKRLEKQEFSNVKKINFAKNIVMNSGISKVGESLKGPDPIFIVPLGIALGIMIIAIFNRLIKMIRRKYTSSSDIFINIFVIATSFVGVLSLLSIVLALTQVASQNSYILAFGLPDSFNYIFTLLLVFVVLLAITLLFFLFRMKKIHNRSVVFSVVFSNVLVLTYFFYWGILL
ncbi:alpha/beta fold hydrolase [Aquimarina pacifica]|uniref:alpha/beta fold hydrolase n=1 Tax=Aquimarina pacifica TaxID=1296415 RepID=UPI00047281A8|nr:alpha/beta fold hydrolase [Aquimarina pacifica]